MLISLFINYLLHSYHQFNSNMCYIRSTTKKGVMYEKSILERLRGYI